MHRICLYGYIKSCFLALELRVLNEKEDFTVYLMLSSLDFLNELNLW